VKPVVFFCCLYLFWGCNPGQTTPVYSPELSKILLNDHFFTGDLVLLPNNASAYVLYPEDSLAYVLSPGGKGRATPSHTLRKVNAYKLFRGCEPGLPLAWALNTEPANPYYQDDLGLSYMYSLGEGKFFRVDYYKHPEKKKASIHSIHLEVSVDNEAEAIRFYREMATWCSAHMGNPEGQMGEFTWKLKARAIRAKLELSGRKKNIFFSLIMDDSANL